MKLLPAAIALLLPVVAEAAEGGPLLHPGSIELGLAASLVSSGVSGSASTMAVRGALLLPAAGGLVGLEGEIGYRHVGNFGDLDQLDASGHLTWQRRLARTAAYPFAGVWSGVQHERVGSFGQTRYPVGAGGGLRVLVTQAAALRVEYRYGRVLDRHASDFNEHRLLTGITLLLRNGS
jgi:hypothetical protein